jgi:hypothetical protein
MLSVRSSESVLGSELMSIEASRVRYSTAVAPS